MSVRVADAHMIRMHGRGFKRRSAGTAIAAVLIAVLVVLAPPRAGVVEAQGAVQHVVLVTLDGVRIEEIFGGLDTIVLQSTLEQEERLEDTDAWRRYGAPTPEARRERLMPFFWGTLMQAHGSIAGNPARGSRVQVTNRHRFSYPGYAEILTGLAQDEVIDSNDDRQNPYPTVLEFLKDRLRLAPAQVAVFASWGTFNFIAERTPGAIAINAGFEAYEHPDLAIGALSLAQRETPPSWDGARYDYYTFRFAMAHLITHRPRVLYLAFDETDDWAHGGEYSRLLDALHRTDAYLRELWEWLQVQPEYRGRTALLVTTDHGRGRTARDWSDHGADVEGAEDVWMAFVSPDVARRGEWTDHPALAANQIAATISRWLGVEYGADHPGAGRPIDWAPRR